MISAVLMLMPGATLGPAKFPYGSVAFRTFVKDSLPNDDKAFYQWFENGLKDAGYGGVDQLLASEKDPEKLAAKVHKAIKKVIPKFSLDRGFEFKETVARGERQCFLQSVLLSGLMQRAGFDSGVAMVWKNIEGSTTNNGHAVPLVRTKQGDLIVDCSDPTPFVKHQGLYLRDGSGTYRFVEPQYDGYRITSYKPLAGKAGVVQGAGLDFLRSQFDYYRGERAPGGFMAAPKTNEGLAASAMYLEKAQKECAQNALAVYVLGRVYARQGKPELAKSQYAKAARLYETAGWVPDGMKDALAGK